MMDTTSLYTTSLYTSIGTSLIDEVHYKEPLVKEYDDITIGAESILSLSNIRNTLIESKGINKAIADSIQSITKSFYTDKHMSLEYTDHITQTNYTYALEYVDTSLKTYEKQIKDKVRILYIKLKEVKKAVKEYLLDIERYQFNTAKIKNKINSLRLNKIKYRVDEDYVEMSILDIPYSSTLDDTKENDNLYSDVRKRFLSFIMSDRTAPIVLSYIHHLYNNTPYQDFKMYIHDYNTQHLTLGLLLEYLVIGRDKEQAYANQLIKDVNKILYKISNGVCESPNCDKEYRETLDFIHEYYTIITNLPKYRIWIKEIYEYLIKIL